MATVALVDGGGYFVTFGDGLWHEVQDTGLLAGYGLSTAGATEYPSADYVQPVVDVLGPAAPAAAASAPAAASAGPARSIPAIVNGSAVYTWDASNGFWRHVPDVATANAMGIDWNNMTAVTVTPTPTGPDWPTVTQAVLIAPTVPAASPTAPSTSAAATASAPTSFQWGGETWTAGQLTAFVGYLAAHGTDYATWAVNHPDAALIFNTDTYPGGNEPVPKSVGEALGAAIAAGATPAEAAAQAAPLATSQATQGFGAPTNDQLVAAASDVAAAYAAAGGVTGSGSGEEPSGSGSDTGPDDRELQGVVPANLFAPSGPPAGVTTSWKRLVSFWSTVVPKSPNDVTSVINQTKALLK
jgi:hypothetical protein